MEHMGRAHIERIGCNDLNFGMIRFVHWNIYLEIFRRGTALQRASSATGHRQTADDQFFARSHEHGVILNSGSAHSPTTLSLMSLGLRVV
jgi:hypothetical protein